MIRAFQATPEQMEDTKTLAEEETTEDSREIEFGPTGGNIMIYEGEGSIDCEGQKLP